MPDAPPYMPRLPAPNPEAYPWPHPDYPASEGWRPAGHHQGYQRVALPAKAPLPPGQVGRYRATRRNTRGTLYHLTLARPWSWALTDRGMRCLFPMRWEDTSLHPPEYALGEYLALYAGREYEAAGAAWVRAALGEEVPPPEALPGGGYVAVGRLVEVGTICNDSRASTDAWWSGGGRASRRGTVAWWLEDVVPFEFLPHPELPKLARLDALLVQDVQERTRAVLEGYYRHTPWCLAPSAPAGAPKPPPGYLAPPEDNATRPAWAEVPSRAVEAPAPRARPRRQSEGQGSLF